MAIFEAPTDETIMTFLMKVGAGGSVRSTTLRAFDKEELARMVEKL